MNEARRFLVVANPIARRGTDSIIDRIRSMAPPGVELDVEYTKPAHMATGELCNRARGCEAVIAVGGDGTVADTVTAVTGVDIPLGIIPAGSTNIIARNLSIPTDLDRAAFLIFNQPTTRRMDVGLCNGRRFLHMGGAGFDSRMFAMTSRKLKRRLGWVAYLQGASKTILAPPVRFTIVIDGEEIECESPLVLVANGASIITPSMKVHPGILYDDGRLDVVIVTAHRAVEIMRVVSRFATRTLEKSPYAIHIQGKEIELRSEPKIPLQLDGDIVGETPAHFSILPLAISIIVPG
jgi:diacylglycerol kinase (ATP)